MQREGLHTGCSSCYKRKPWGCGSANRQSQHPAFPLVSITHFTTEVLFSGSVILFHLVCQSNFHYYGLLPPVIHIAWGQIISRYLTPISKGELEICTVRPHTSQLVYLLEALTSLVSTKIRACPCLGYGMPEHAATTGFPRRWLLHGQQRAGECSCVSSRGLVLSCTAD